MYALLRRSKLAMSGIAEEAARRVREGAVPILRAQPGFRLHLGFLSEACEAVGVSLFDDRASARAAQEPQGVAESLLCRCTQETLRPALLWLDHRGERRRRLDQHHRRLRSYRAGTSPCSPASRREPARPHVRCAAALRMTPPISGGKLARPISARGIRRGGDPWVTAPVPTTGEVTTGPRPFQPRVR